LKTRLKEQYELIESQHSQGEAEEEELVKLFAKVKTEEEAGTILELSYDLYRKFNLYLSHYLHHLECEERNIPDILAKFTDEEIYAVIDKIKNVKLPDNKL
jgi:redox-regulated HSP33 family molecular chaperone